MPFETRNKYGCKFRRGASNPKAKLSPEGVRAIRWLKLELRAPVASIADAANVSTVTIYNILKDKTWNWVKN